MALGELTHPPKKRWPHVATQVARYQFTWYSVKHNDLHTHQTSVSRPQGWRISVPVWIHTKNWFPRCQLPNKNFLHMRREYNHDSWLVFLNIVKAFDTVYHNLLFQLLAQYGIPQNLVSTVKILYTDFRMTLKIGEEQTIIDYLTGVKQGDVLSPTIFLFLMKAMVECVIEMWKR